MRHSGANSADVAASADALRKFFVTLSAISHNPLLAAVCKAITEIQVGIAVELSGGRSGDFGRVSGALFDARIDIVDAIASRDSHAAADRVREYHRRVIERTRTLPRAKQLRATDPGLAGLLSNWLAANVRLDNAPGGH